MAILRGTNSGSLMFAEIMWVTHNIFVVFVRLLLYCVSLLKLFVGFKFKIIRWPKNWP